MKKALLIGSVMILSTLSIASCSPKLSDEEALAIIREEGAYPQPAIFFLRIYVGSDDSSGIEELIAKGYFNRNSSRESGYSRGHLRDVRDIRTSVHNLFLGCPRLPLFDPEPLTCSPPTGRF